MSYPAVTKEGDYSGGLKPTGSSGGSCRTERFQQVYSRVRFFTKEEMEGKFRGARYAVMYAYFFPKDQGGRQGLIGKPQGHRYDWEEVVVFFNKNRKAIKAAASAHGGYSVMHRRTKNDEKYWSGNHIQVRYGRKNWSSLLNNSLSFTKTKVVSNEKEACWMCLTKAARDTLNTHDWDKASPKFVDSKFTGRVDKAWAA